MSVEFEYMDHVAVRVKQLEPAAQWYKEVLGFEIATRWDNVWLLRHGQTRIGLYLAPDAVAVADPQKKLTLHHFAYYVTTAQFIAAEVFMKDNNIPYDGPKDSGYFWSLFLTDPDGYRIELITDHAEELAAKT